MNKLSTNVYAYTLPKELIAQSAHHPPDECRLMVVKPDGIEHKQFIDIIKYLHKDDVIVVNQTKVSHTKLVGRKSTGGKAEVILTRPLGELTYEARIKAGKLREGVVLVFQTCSATIIQRIDDMFTILFDRAPAQIDLTFPTPPYIETPVPEQDYQTMFAKQEGSLAAPTAALHFTPTLVQKLESKGVRFVAITLHIGFGTFLPVHDIATHKTEPEQIEITKEAAEIINAATCVIAVGTTTVKALETASKEGKVQSYKGTSDIFLTPGHVFKSRIDAMITNFHLPKSSLLMLTCAYGGTNRIMNAYSEAVHNRYRFYSLGDVMLIWT